MNAITTTRAGNTSLAPSNLGEAMSFAKMLADSDMVPRDFKGKPANCLVAIQWGYEVGLGPLQAVQNIAVINGRPSIWGDAALALVRGHRDCVSVREGVEGEGDARFGWCEVTRRGEPPQRRTFSVADAKKAGLWGKSGPWQQYPDRMLQLRARGFAIRDVFPDALRGVITAEEAQDMPPEPREVPNLAAEPVRAAPGSMREVAAEIVGRPVDDAQHPAEPEALPLIAPDGRLLEVRSNGAPAIIKWGKWAMAALAKLESSDAVREWRRANGPHFASISEIYPDQVAEVERTIEQRLAELSDVFPGDLPSGSAGA